MTRSDTRCSSGRSRRSSSPRACASPGASSLAPTGTGRARRRSRKTCSCRRGLRTGDHGLFALAAHMWAKELKASPASIAERASRVKQVSPFAPLRPEGPYVNFTVDPAPFAELVLSAVRSDGETYGTSPARKERVLLEHTSANPTGPLHVGRARNPFRGDALVRLMRAAGYKVTSEYLVNDIGRQMVLLYWAVAHIPEDSSASAERIEYRYVKVYQQASAKLEGDETLKREIERLTQRFEGGDVQLTKDIRKVGEA